MKILTYCRYFVYMIPAALVLLGILAAFSGKQSLQSRLGEGLHGLVRRIPAIALLTVLYFGLLVGVNGLHSRTEARTVIGFNYKEASQGMNPNSTRFNTYDIISDEVLTEALDRLGSGLTVRQLRSTLSISPLAAGKSASAERYYISTEYELAYRANLKTLWMDAKKTVDTVAEVYQEQFLKTYSRNTDVLTVDFAQVDAVDYLDKPDLMKEMANKIKDYMDGCRLNDSTFRSSSGESFADVGSRASKFRDVTLERLNSYILANGVSEDTEQYISRLNYDNTIKSVTYQKNLAAYQLRLDVIDFYERDLASIVLVPTRDEDGEFYMGRTKIGVDNFAVEAEDFMKNASNLQKTIETNNYEIGQLRQGGGGDRAAVDQLLEAAKEELRGVEASARQILKEYDEAKSSNILVVTPRGRGIKTMFQLKRCVIFTGGFLVALTAFFVANPKKKKMNYRSAGRPYAQARR